MYKICAMMLIFNVFTHLAGARGHVDHKNVDPAYHLMAIKQGMAEKELQDKEAQMREEARNNNLNENPYDNRSGQNAHHSYTDNLHDNLVHANAAQQEFAHANMAGNHFDGPSHFDASADHNAGHYHANAE